MLPIFLTNYNNENKILIVGGGSVGLRRAIWLIDSGITCIDVISTELDSGFTDIKNSINFIHSEYRPQDLSKYLLAFACTNVRAINDLVANDAKSAGILFNQADAPQASDFMVPVSIKQTDLEIAICSGIPSYSKKLKQQIETMLPDNAGEFTRALKNIREILKRSNTERAAMRQVLEVFSSARDATEVINLNNSLHNIDESLRIAAIFKLYSQITE